MFPDVDMEKIDSSEPVFGVSDAVALFNQILETATSHITVVGEVANFKVNHGKWVFFDIKDQESTLSCFMSVFNLRIALEDGMKVAVTARPNVTRWGKFSLTVQTVRPLGDGSIKRSFELLRAKLDQEGLFSPERKRTLPDLPRTIGIISSIEAAGYADFIKIVGERFSGLVIQVAHVPVQGDGAAERMIAALNYFNELASPPEVIALLRGGGSRDDLVAFDDEPLVRAIARSRIPVITGVGHEIDVTLADLVADVRASTPSNAAEVLVPDKREILAEVDFRLHKLLDRTEQNLVFAEKNVHQDLREILLRTENILTHNEQKFHMLRSTLASLNPREILRRGYAIIRDAEEKVLREKPQISDTIIIESLKYLIEGEVKNVREKS